MKGLGNLSFAFVLALAMPWYASLAAQRCARRWRKLALRPTQPACGEPSASEPHPPRLTPPSHVPVQTAAPFDAAPVAQAEEVCLAKQCPLCRAYALSGCWLDPIRVCMSCRRIVGTTSRGKCVVVSVGSYSRAARLYRLPAVGEA